MHLHARIIDPEFWGDMEYVQAFSPMERLFYLGLVQLADDSGCLLDSPLEFKAKLYPIDFDILPGQVTEWRDHLVSAKKAIPYTSNGKKCLYLVNFHRHQKKRYWDAPEVPLPTWVQWNPTPTASHRGTYEHGTPLVQDWSGCGKQVVCVDSDTVRMRSDAAPDAYANADAYADTKEKETPSESPSPLAAQEEPYWLRIEDAPVRLFCECMGLGTKTEVDAAKVFLHIKGLVKQRGAEAVEDAILTMDLKNARSPFSSVSAAMSYLRAVLSGKNTEYASKPDIPEALKPVVNDLIGEYVDALVRLGADINDPPEQKWINRAAWTVLEALKNDAKWALRVSNVIGYLEHTKMLRSYPSCITSALRDWPARLKQWNTTDELLDRSPPAWKYRTLSVPERGALMQQSDGTYAQDESGKWVKVEEPAKGA